MTDTPIGSTVRRTFRLATFLDYLARRGFQEGNIYPDDEPSGRVIGPNHDRVMVIGEATAMGYGIRTHELGVAAQFARKLSARTGRGVEWSTVGLRGNRLRSAPRVCAREQAALARTDVVILITGIVDTLTLTSTATWTQNLRATLTALHRELPVDARVLIAETPPLSSLGAINALARRASTHQAKLLNDATRAIVADYPQCVTVPFPPGIDQQMWRPEYNAPAFAVVYGQWAQAMLDAMFESPVTLTRATDWIAANGLRSVGRSSTRALLPTAALGRSGLSLTAIGICMDLLNAPGRSTDPYESGLDEPEDIAVAIDELISGGYAVRVSAPQ
ncbi:MAG: hypothetical protein JWP19_411 [Rhodoglobus sp.]|nr:hypothetical protein [Rhodoglobus sp.]